MRVLAPSGSGKSTAAERFVDLLERRERPGPTVKLAVKVSLTSAATPKKLFSDILTEMGDGLADRGTEQTLRRRVTSIGGGYKPWATLLAEALAGSLPYGLEYSGGYELKLGGLRIHWSVAEDIRRRALSQPASIYRTAPESLGGLRPKCLSRSEAQCLLNCLPADISRLCEHRRLKVLDKDPVSFDARSVEAFAERYVSIQELSALLQIKAGELARSLSYRDFPRSQSGFWRRRDLWGPAGIIASYESDPIFSVWEIPGAAKPVSYWPGLKPLAFGQPLKLFSPQQPDHS